MHQKPSESILNVIATIIIIIPYFIFLTLKLIFMWFSYAPLFWWMAKHPNYTDSVKNTSGYWIMIAGFLLLMFVASAACSWYHLHCL